MGLERTLAVLNGLEDNYLTEVWKPILEKIEQLSKKKYSRNEKSFRIIADHVKASFFILADGIKPSNTEQGYVLRRLIRRTIRHLREIGIEEQIIEIAKPIFKIYKDYKHLQKNKKEIINELSKEHKKFLESLDKGIKEFYKIIKNIAKEKSNKQISGKDAFLLYQSYGFPIEITKEIAREKNLEVDIKGFYKQLKKHQEISRQADKGKFKSGLADSGEQTTKLHTATHLLNQALREVLNKPEIYQKGSNINPERLRFDFNFDRKLTDEEKNKIEEWINKQIQKNLPVTMKEMSIDEAEKFGAVGIFQDKYKKFNKIKIYMIGPDPETKQYVSKEICSGPHVSSTKELGKFKIKKEQSSSSGVRRIKAILG
jgi:alanyl-tRNA synthetase